MKWRAEFELFRAGYRAIQWQNKLLSAQCLFAVFLESIGSHIQGKR